ncbi:MAG: CHASE2 domain-containing protein [Deltaproteobacteria bacterium]|nr:CHASE2 domain-containing protein [Deltaproteobacteria bacterium]
MSREAVQKTLLAKPENKNRWILLSGCIFTLVFSLVYVYQPLFFRFLDSKLYDTLLNSSPRGTPSNLPVIVDLDEKSLSRFGQWPWPRYRIALLLEKIKASGALSIGLDMMFPEPDRTSLDALQKDLIRDLKIQVDLGRISKRLPDNDRFMAETLSRGPFVLGFKFLFPPEKSFHKETLLHPWSAVIMTEKGGTVDKSFLFQATGAIGNLEVLAKAAPLSGFFNVSPDPDGVIRRVPLLIEYQQKFYPCLALATLGQAFGLKQIVLKTGPDGLESIRLGDTTIPVDGRGNLLIRYRGKGKTFPYIPAGDILTGAVSRERLQGKIVLLGTSAAGLGELRPAPLDPVFPGPEVHATIVDNLIRKDFFSRPYWISGVELVLILVAGLSTTLLLTWTGAAWSLLPLGLLALGLWQTSLWLLHSKGLFFSCLFPLMVLGGNFSFLTLLKYRREEQKVRDRTRELLLTQDFTILCLASLTETRDSETGGHILRCQQYIKILARQLARNPVYSGILQPDSIDILYKSSPLHDIGKVGVRDNILLKPGRLTEEEFKEMKRHTLYGRQAIQLAEDKFGQGVNSTFLQYGKEMAYTHHERWDGSGYPEGLQGEEIPLFGRIMALVDVYDALICKRIYKPAFSHEEAVTFIVEQKRIFFDPGVVEAFLAVHEEFKKIAQTFADHEEGS